MYPNVLTQTLHILKHLGWQPIWFAHNSVLGRQFSFSPNKDSNQSPFLLTDSSHERFMDRFSEVFFSERFETICFVVGLVEKTSWSLANPQGRSNLPCCFTGPKKVSPPGFRVPRTVKLMAEVGRETEIGRGVSKLQSEYFGHSSNDDGYLETWYTLHPKKYPNHPDCSLPSKFSHRFFGWRVFGWRMKD